MIVSQFDFLKIGTRFRLPKFVKNGEGHPVYVKTGEDGALPVHRGVVAHSSHFVSIEPDQKVELHDD